MLDKNLKKQLVIRSQKLNPVVIIGDKGLTDALFEEIEVNLIAHQLIKIRINANDREERNEMIAMIAERSQAELVHQIGHVASFYRPKPKSAH